MFPPLYTADEMRAAEQGHDVEAIDGSGRAVRWLTPFCAVIPTRGASRCGLRKGRERRRRPDRAARPRGSGAGDDEELDGADVVIDALFGTGFNGEPRPRLRG